ncbi:MAG TPA: pyridoxamine 5'-phosphate oxidase family protein [Blastocatellia bacterium]|nr:pyridoxamine 5'-phosphate oxidase family protein [Blastocatellia bacterium]
MSSFAQTDRTTLKRLPARGTYDRETVYKILDEAVVCHVGFSVDGQPYVIPTGFGRIDDKLYIHGSAASRMLRSIEDGINVCVTITLIDGLVLARSAFHHSFNYRSVVVLGTAHAVDDSAEKMTALHTFTDHVMPGRWQQVRIPTEAEMKATLVLCLPMEEVSAKIRTGPPIDDEDDYSLPIWAGVLPLSLTPSEPVNDPKLNPGLEPPANVKNYSRTH